jgi:hypothetical protein
VCVERERERERERKKKEEEERRRRRRKEEERRRRRVRRRRSRRAKTRRTRRGRKEGIYKNLYKLVRAVGLEWNCQDQIQDPCLHICTFSLIPLRRSLHWLFRVAL